MSMEPWLYKWLNAAHVFDSKSSTSYIGVWCTTIDIDITKIISNYITNLYLYLWTHFFLRDTPWYLFKKYHATSHSLLSIVFKCGLFGGRRSGSANCCFCGPGKTCISCALSFWKVNQSPAIRRTTDSSFVLTAVHGNATAAVDLLKERRVEHFLRVYKLDRLLPDTDLPCLHVLMFTTVIPRLDPQWRTNLEKWYILFGNGTLSPM